MKLKRLWAVAPRIRGLPHIRLSPFVFNHTFYRDDGFRPGDHNAGLGFYPSRYANQRWFKGEGRRRRDPDNGLLRIGGQVYF